jgi:KaiC/GvpD/RAD55 family RecA-like ATPase
MSKKKNGNGFIFGAIFTGAFFLLVKVSCLIVGNSLKGATSTPKNKSETLDQVKDGFVTDHDWGRKQLTSEQTESDKTMPVIVKQDSANFQDDCLLFKRYFHRHETCCIVAKPGVGKTFLACFIARNTVFKYVVYFELDDGYCQKERLMQVPSIHPIFLPEFNQTLKKIEKNADDIINKRAIVESFTKVSTQIENRRQRLMQEIGIVDDRKADKLLLFEIYLEEAISHGADLIILDSLNALFDYPWNIIRKYIKRITDICRKSNIPFLIIHHTNKEGDYSGTSGLAEVVDTLLKIDTLKGNLRGLTVIKAKFSLDTEGCIMEMISEGPHSVRFEMREESLIYQRKDITPLDRKILDFLGDKNTVDFEELCSMLSTTNQTSIKNSLLKLEKQGCLEKDDGKSWAIIKNCTGRNSN